MRNLVILLFIALFRALGQDASGNAVIFHISPTAAAGDVIYIQGSGFGASPKVEYSYNDSGWSSFSVITSGSNTAMVQLPTSQSRLPDLLTIRISPDGSHWSTPAYVNQAKALSFDTNQIGSGNRFRIFGRNLLFSRTPIVHLVDIADSAILDASVDTGSSTSYALTAIAPSGIQANHTYAVYVSNGYNGNGSTGGATLAPTTLLGRRSGTDYWNLGVPWASDLNFYSNVYNVQTDPRLSQHASGNGGTNDINVINSAIAMANNAGGGVVYLPAGTYDLYFSSGCGVPVDPRVVVMGAGASNTFVNFGYGAAPSANDGGWAVCLTNPQSGISDITFNNVNQSGHWPQSIVGLNTSEIFLQRTNWNIGTAQWVVMQNNTNLTIQNSSITQGLDTSYNGPLSLQGSANLVLRGNSIKYVAGALEFDRTTNTVFENNRVTRDASQTPPAGVITHVIVGNFTNNFMVLNNSFGVTGGTLAQVNDGETIGTEAGGATRYDEFRGTVQSAGSNYITDGSQNFNWSSNNAVPNLHVGAILAIVGGQGAGQWGTITAVSSDGHTAWVKNDWAVEPVSGSRYATFDWSSANWILASNILSDNEKGIEFWGASIRDILVTNNTLTNNGEILISPDERPDGSGTFNFVVDTQILSNTLTDTNHLRPAAISAVPREDNQNNNIGTAIIGLELRGNAISGFTPNTVYSDASLDDAKALAEGFNLYWQWQTTWSDFIDDGVPALVGTVIQGNIFTNSAAVIHANTLLAQTVLSGNSLHTVASGIVDATIPGATHASVDTVTLNTSAVAPPKVVASTSGVPELTAFGASGYWASQSSPSDIVQDIQFGTDLDVPIPGDYDGDGLIDCAVFRPSEGAFYVRPSHNPSAMELVYFADPGDIPEPGDYDGDGKTDISVFRPSTGQWFYSPSSHPGAASVTVQTGALSTDIPVPADYDGDGITDFAYFRPSNGAFYIIYSANPMKSAFVFYFGVPGDIAVPGDYDGDGKAGDMAVVNPSTGVWSYWSSKNPQLQPTQATGERSGDIPASRRLRSRRQNRLRFLAPVFTNLVLHPQQQHQQDRLNVTGG